MKEKILNEIVLSLSTILDSEKLREVENVIRIKLHNIKLENKSTELSTYNDDNDYILRLFASNKKLENKSEKSIEQYVLTTRKMLIDMDRNYKDITTNDIKYYLAMYQVNRKVSPNTISNMKRFISAFYSWACDEGYVCKNPVRPIKSIKQTVKEKEYLNNEEIELMRDSCITLREKAIFEFLLSTGLRVSEFVALNIDSIDLRNDTIKIYAPKTRSYRTGYLSAKAKLAIAKYLMVRNDSNVALIISKDIGSKRLGNGSIQKELQKIAKRAGINKHVTVHLLRKTFATKLSSSGVNIEIIKELLGHADISMTAKHYVTVNQDEIKMAHKRCAA